MVRLRASVSLMDYFSDNNGWCWYISVNADDKCYFSLISVGFVMHEEYFQTKGVRAHS